MLLASTSLVVVFSLTARDDISLDELSEREIASIDSVVTACEEAANFSRRDWSRGLHESTDCLYLIRSFCIPVMNSTDIHLLKKNELQLTLENYFCEAMHTIEASHLGYILAARYGREYYGGRGKEFDHYRKSIENHIQVLFGILEVNSTHISSEINAKLKQLTKSIDDIAVNAYSAVQLED